MAKPQLQRSWGPFVYIGWYSRFFPFLLPALHGVGEEEQEAREEAMYVAAGRNGRLALKHVGLEPKPVLVLGRAAPIHRNRRCATP